MKVHFFKAAIWMPLRFAFNQFRIWIWTQYGWLAMKRLYVANRYYESDFSTMMMMVVMFFFTSWAVPMFLYKSKCFDNLVTIWMCLGIFFGHLESFWNLDIEFAKVKMSKESLRKFKSFLQSVLFSILF